MSMHRSTSLKSQRNPERYICKIFENIFLYFYLSLLGALRDNVCNRVLQILMERNQLATFRLFDKGLSYGEEIQLAIAFEFGIT